MFLWPRFRVSLLPYLVGVLHLGAVALYFYFVRDTFFGGDSSYYLAMARALVTGEPVHDLFHRPIGYSLLLALAYLLSGDVVANAIALNWGLYFLVVRWTGRIVSLLSDRRDVAVIAQLVFVTIPNMAIFANLVLGELAATWLLCLGVEAVLRLRAAEACAGARAARAAELGVVAAALSLVRTEYVLLFPLLLGFTLWRGSRRRRVVRVVPIACALAGFTGLALGVAYGASAAAGGRVPVTAAPSVAYLKLWLSFYDFELTHNRVHRLVDLTRVDVAPLDDEALRRAVGRLRLDYRGHSPVAAAVLDRAEVDLRDIRRTYQETRDLGTAYRRAFAARLSESPLTYLRRIGYRLVLYVAAVDLDWSLSRGFLVSTLVLAPVAIAGYWSLASLLMRGDVFPRAPLAVVGLVAVYSVIVHAPMHYEQRLILPAAPLLSVCLAGGLALLLGRPVVGVVTAEGGLG